MKPLVHFRLSLMMFIQFCSIGVIVPLMSLYMKQCLGFSGAEIGTIFAAASISSFVAPLIGVFVADRFIRAKHLLSLCQFGIGVSLVTLYFMTSFGSVLALYVIFSLLIGPTFSLTNAITFHNSTDTTRSFGSIRLWGTVGWIAVGWALSFFWFLTGGDQTSRLPDILIISAICSFLLSIYALTLPSPVIKRDRREGFIPVESIRVFRKRNVLLLAVLSFLIVFVERFHFFGASPFLRQIGFSEQSILPSMSLGQFSEIIAIAVTGAVLTRIGFKKTILLGIFFEGLRFLMYFIAAPGLLVYAGLTLHGFTYPFIFMATAIYIDSQCSIRARTGVQLLITMITGGLAGITGNIACGMVMDFASGAGTTIDFSIFWGIPLALTFAVFAGCVIFIKKSWRARVKGLISGFRAIWQP
jgi:MFS family permease